jgi:dipeptidyl aminopeptidase/acylaminoacyl peptidase
VAYQTPAPDIVSIIDAPPTPVAALGPGRKYAVLVHYEMHPPVTTLARPYLALAGVRVDPAIAGRQRTRRLTGLSVMSLTDGAIRPLDLPDGKSVSVPAWAPDGLRFVFTVDETDGIAVWVGDARDATAAPVPGLRVRDVLGGDPTSAGSTVRWTRDGRQLLCLSAPGPVPDLPAEPIEPHIEESAGKHSQMATFQDLLRTDADADIFEQLATTVPVRVDPVSGAVLRPGAVRLLRPHGGGLGARRRAGARHRRPAGQ